MSHDSVVHAVNRLIEAPNYSALISEVTRIIENWDRHPMRYAGQLSWMNAILNVGLQSREAFERLVALIEEKRRQHPDVKRTDYQRDLMRARRAREAMALALHERRHGVIRGAARITELADIRARWNREKREFLAARGTLSWKERNDATREFWEEIDRKLELNLKNSPRLVSSA